MSLSWGMLSGAYGLGWALARPILARNERLKDGLAARTLAEPLPEAEVWMQAASAGEAHLAGEILRRLTPGRPLRVLTTTGTRQGMDALTALAGELRAAGSEVTALPAFFPFDAPALMGKALGQARPRLAVILETELWPGFLSACRKAGTPVLLANGRMSTRSLARYLLTPGLWKELAPDRVMAISEEDALRFGLLFGAQRVEVMPNIKFDRAMAAPLPRSENPVVDLLPLEAEFAVFGSIRREEEEAVGRVLDGYFGRRPEAVAGVFPRHLDRVGAWEERLAGLGLPFVRRSRLAGPVPPGMVILWDVFGELVTAYAAAQAAFVGGSLAPVGGQNFLEPLTCGVIPVVGPHWSNFAWLGREIFGPGLARQVSDAEAAAEELAALSAHPERPEAVRERALAYVSGRRGGAERVCARIADLLGNG